MGSSLRFGSSYPGWLLFFIACGALGIYLWSYYRTRADAPGRLKYVLPALRGAGAFIILLCLAQPILRIFLEEEVEPTVGLALDVSQSMSLRDAPGGRTRGESGVRVLEDAASKLSGFALKRYVFDGKLHEATSFKDASFKGEPTALLDCLTDLARERLTCVVLATDGADNASADAEDALSALAESRIPVYVMGLGEVEVRDVSIEDVVARRRVAMETTVEVKVKARGRGFEGLRVPVKLSRKGSVIDTKDVVLSSSPKLVEFSFLPVEQGFVEYTVEIPAQELELSSGNNNRTFGMEVSSRKLRVLYMEGSEYRREGREMWEFQYLEQALEEDPLIDEVHCLFRKDAERAREAGIKCVTDPDGGFPRTRKELFGYDAIISSDIDIEFFTEDQLKNTVDFVGRHGGGFVMIGGWTAFGPGGYDESIVDKMLPVDMLGRFERYVEYDIAEGAGFKLELTDEGREHPLMRLESDGEKNRRLWDECPEFYGYNKVQRAKPGATVLAVHPYDRNLYGKHVLVAVQQYGRGRSMAFCTDTTAGWGTRFEEDWGVDGDRRHYKEFWQNAVRWLAAYRMQAPNSLVLVETDRALYEKGSRVGVRVRALDEDYEPAGSARVEASVRTPSGKSSSMKVTARPGEPGVFACSFEAAEPGLYRIAASAALKGEKLGQDSCMVSVEEASRELRDCGRNLRLLERIASKTGGKVLDETSGGVAVVRDELLERLSVLRRHRDEDLWDSWWLLGAVVALLGTEWALRKRAGMP